MAEEGAFAAYQSYFREIELHWSWRRERQIIVSPLEFETVQGWHESGVPIAVVLRAIDLFVERKKKSGRNRPYLLTHLQQTIEKVHREYQSLREGEAEAGEGLLTGKLRGFIRKIKALTKAHPDEKAFLDGLTTDLKALEGQDARGFEGISEQLSSLDLKLLQCFEKRLSADDAAGIREDALSLLAEEEDPEFFQKLLCDGVRMHFGLPRLTILG